MKKYLAIVLSCFLISALPFINGQVLGFNKDSVQQKTGIYDTKEIDTHATMLAWSPNGRFISYSWNKNSKSSDTKIKIVDLNNLKRRTIGVGFAPVWLDSQNLLTSNLDCLNIKSQYKRKFIESFNGSSNLAVSKDRKHIAKLTNLGEITDTRDIYQSITILEKDSVGNWKEELVFSETGPCSLQRIVGWLSNHELVFLSMDYELMVIDLNKCKKIDITYKGLNQYYDSLIKLGTQIKLLQVTKNAIAGKIKGDFISCDGKYAAVNTPYPGGINVIDLSSGKVVHHIITKNVNEEDIKWSPTENLLAYIEHSPEITCAFKVVDLRSLH